MKKHQKIIRHSRLFNVNAHGHLSQSSVLTSIFADIQHCFPVITQIIWSSYRAGNEIHELLIDHDSGRFVLTVACGLGPTEFTAITDEDLAISHKQVELVDSTDIFHFIRLLIEIYHFKTIHIDDEKMIYSS